MARVKSSTRYIGGATGGGSGGEGHESRGFERTESARLSDAGSHSGADDIVDKGSRSRSCFFGPSTVTVSRIRGMIESGYFAEGMHREPREETVPEPNPDEDVVFEEFFAVGLWMPSYHVLSDILPKFQVQIYQLTPSAIVQLSKYIGAVVSFGGIP
jgi:hypothetical protein